MSDIFVEAKDLSYTYMPKTPFETTALRDVSFHLERGSFTALAGHTGSGKSTLVQLLAGLIEPTAGEVCLEGVPLTTKEKAMRAHSRMARRRVGMVFQYPEQQLFEESVARDIAFGPEHLGLSPAEVQERIEEALALVELDYDACKNANPFALSGGQRRRVAIAGILALQPDFLILDEPMAGLDPTSCESLKENIKKLHKKNMTVLLVSHNMDDIAELADHVLILKDGLLHLAGTPAEVFSHPDEIRAAGLALPQMKDLLCALKKEGFPVSANALTEEDGVAEILAAFGKGKGERPC